MAGQGSDLGPVTHIPQVDQFVGACGRERTAIGRERDTAHGRSMS